MAEYRPDNFRLETETQKKSKDGQVEIKRRRISFEPEDIIATVAGVVAIIFAVGHVVGSDAHQRDYNQHPDIFRRGYGDRRDSRAREEAEVIRPHQSLAVPRPTSG